MLAGNKQPAPRASGPVRVADAVVDTLAELGVRTFFGIPGGAISPVYDALVDRSDLRVIHSRHETGAVFAGMGFARTGGGLPCVLMTSGPGVTNAITGIAAAHADGVPLLCIAGEVPKRNYGRGALQEGSRHHLDVLGMVRSITKMSAEATNARAVTALVRKAVATALSGRQGPVFLSLPLDVATEAVVPTTSSTRVSTFFEWDEALLDEAARRLNGARRGLILAGSGARGREAASLLGSLATALQMPVATTPKAKGVFPDSDPLALGIFGHGGHPSASRYIEAGVDVLLAVGCGLGETGTNSWTQALQPKECFIQVDIDGGQIGKNYQVDIGILGPAHVVLQKLLSRVHRRPRAVAPLSGGPELLKPELAATDTVPLHPARVVRLLQERFPRETIFTSDIGEHMMFALHYLRAEEPDGFIVNSGFGSMGSGIGSAIGAKLAHPERAVVSICGDYGFLMYGAELATCVQERIGVVFAVFNDARMGMIENGLSIQYGRAGNVRGPRTDFAAMARGMGARAYSIASVDDLLQIPAEALAGDVPVVLDVAIDPGASFSKNGRAESLKSFSSSDG